MGPEIIPATSEHIAHIAAHIRPADKAELAEIWRQSPVVALVDSLNQSTHAWTGLVDDEPICMFGVASGGILGDVGRPWMIGTTKLDKYAVIFLRRCKGCVELMQSEYSTLINMVAADNELAIRWLKWLGFEMGEVEAYGKTTIRRFHRNQTGKHHGMQYTRNVE